MHASAAPTPAFFPWTDTHTTAHLWLYDTTNERLGRTRTLMQSAERIHARQAQQPVSAKRIEDRSLPACVSNVIDRQLSSTVSPEVSMLLYVTHDESSQGGRRQRTRRSPRRDSTPKASRKLPRASNGLRNRRPPTATAPYRTPRTRHLPTALLGHRDMLRATTSFETHLPAVRCPLSSLAA